MRKLNAASVAIIMAVALYFTLSWGYQGLDVLVSPSYGLEDVWRSQFVFVIGGWFGLGPVGLLKLAAFFGGLKLAVAGICGVHFLDRLRAFIRGKADSDILEGGLILVVLVSLMSARSGGVVAECRTGARTGAPVVARSDRDRALPGRAQLRPDAGER